MAPLEGAAASELDTLTTNTTDTNNTKGKGAEFCKD